MAPPPHLAHNWRPPADLLASDGKRGNVPGAAKGYSLVRAVGKGEFGKALLVQDKPGNHRVMKTVDISKLDARQRKDAVQEVTVLSSLKHPYIVRYRESFIEGGTLAIVMDYAEGGDLYRKIHKAKAADQPFGEAQIVRWITQALLGLTYLHGRSVMHRDIKSQNLFLTKHQNVRIGDFGISKVLRESNGQLRDRDRKGTPYYLSPEILKEALYSFASDVWALGCVLFEMGALRVPFEAQSLPQLVQKIQRGPAPLLPGAFTKELRRLGADMLGYDHSRRPSAPELLNRAFIQAEMKYMLSDGVEHTPASSTATSGAATPSIPDASTSALAADIAAIPFEAPSRTPSISSFGGAVHAGSAAAMLQSMRRSGSAPSISNGHNSSGSSLASNLKGAMKGMMRGPKQRSVFSPNRLFQAGPGAQRRNSRCHKDLMFGKVTQEPLVPPRRAERSARNLVEEDASAQAAEESDAPEEENAAVPAAVVRAAPVAFATRSGSLRHGVGNATTLEPPKSGTADQDLTAPVPAGWSLSVVHRGANDGPSLATRSGLAGPDSPPRPASASTLSPQQAARRSASAGALVKPQRPTSSPCASSLSAARRCGGQEMQFSVTSLAQQAAGRPTRAGSASRNRGPVIAFGGGPPARAF